MSFILDALKKSEHERQRQAIPGLVEPSIVRPRARLPPWAIVLCILLGINLLALSLMLARSWITTPAPSSNVASSTAKISSPTEEAEPSVPVESHARPGTGAMRGADVPDKPFSPLDQSPVYAPEVPVNAADARNMADARGASDARDTSADLTNRSFQGGSSAPHTVRRRDIGVDAPSLAAAPRQSGNGPVLNDGDYKPADEEVLPSINEINLTGSQALPELHLDVHVFATKAAERFVFINMRKYHEGATLQEGPTIERIRRDGVILNYNGLRFLLPRQ